MREKQVLITGGNGYLGMRLARAYLDLTDLPVLLWLRARNTDEFESKRHRLQQQFGRFEPRVNYAWGDLVSDHPFDSIDPQKIRVIIHSAAVTKFNVDEDTAQRVNIEGTEKLLRFAGQCRSLEAFGLLSTVYASGLAPGVIGEVPFDDDRKFANHYERSKWASEKRLMTEFDYLPWRILRVATVVADDASGHVTQFNAVHNTLKLLYYGLLSIVPGKPDTPLYFVTGDFVTQAVFNAMRNPTNKAIYHVCHTRSQSLSLDEMIDVAFECFSQHQDFKSRRLMKPLYVDSESFGLLGDAMDTFGGTIVNQALSSVSPFAGQLFVEKEFLNERLVSTIGGYRPSDERQAIRNACEYLVRTKWGKEECGDIRPEN
ncbi:MAG TPA: SDR family oxidoreductase [Terriglobia bacterium]|nr:SDR family oxidoreductase [Terriglobia bacterium]